jgi:hypothetical protein
MANKELVSDLVSLIAFIKANDDFDFTRDPRPVDFNFRLWYLRSDEDRKEVFADLARRMGTLKKAYGDNFMWLKRDFGKHVQMTVSAERSAVCERIVTGTRDVPEHVLPAREETLVEAHTEEIVEWRCPPILAPDTEAQNVGA